MGDLETYQSAGRKAPRHAGWAGCERWTRELGSMPAQQAVEGRGNAPQKTPTGGAGGSETPLLEKLHRCLGQRQGRAASTIDEGCYTRGKLWVAVKRHRPSQPTKLGVYFSDSPGIHSFLLTARSSITTTGALISSAGLRTRPLAPLPCTARILAI